MTNARTELQYRIILGLAEQAQGSGLLTADRPVAVRE